MVTRRFLYLAALAGCLVFYYAYQEWFGWFALVGLLCLPVFSLIISLPAMLTVKLRLQLPEEAPPAAQITASPEYRCPLPVPPARYKLRVRHRVTGETLTCKPERQLPTEHCGTLEIQACKAWAYDYLGLFRLRIRNLQTYTLQISPVPVPIENPPQPKLYMATAWRPKPGGGFSENYDLRQYRPGDNLRQIHWKLVAKTGDLIFREPTEPVQGKLVLCLVQPSDGEILDLRFGNLLWLSRYLLEMGLSHEIRCLTGQGILRCPVENEAALQAALKTLLAAPAAPKDAQLPEPEDAFWYYRIGGESDAV